MDFLRTAAEEIATNRVPGLRLAVDKFVRQIRTQACEQEALALLRSRNDVGSRWALADLVEHTDGGTADADALYARVVDAEGREIPDVLLRRARLSSQAGDLSRAAGFLRLALQQTTEYSFFVRAEALVRRCRSQFPIRRQCRIALLGSSTTSLLKSVLEMQLLRDGIAAEFYEGPFGAFRQEILDGDSGFYQFQPDFCVILTNWRDAGLDDIAADPAGAIASARESFLQLWKLSRSRVACHIIQPGFAAPWNDPYYALSSMLPGGRRRLLRELNGTLLENAPASVTLLDTEAIAAACPARWEDPLQWSSTKVYPAPDALPVLGEHIVSCVRSASGLSSKLLALDLDNTLWGGIIGEDGLGGIKLGPPSAKGERYQDFQRYLKRLSDRGILLAVVSKNNPQDAAEVFERHESAALRMSDFVAFEANWDPKPESLVKISRTLGLGLDSFVFLDDNPTERAAVRAQLPEILIPEISGEPAESIEMLERGLYFQATAFTEEDRARSASYHSIVAAAGARESGGNVAEYLESLQMELAWGPVDEQTRSRVAQLINKTNQFNLTTRRYTEAQVSAFMNSDRHWFRWFRLRDRFADHGLIAIMLAEEMSDTIWRVDLWLMSCRVIGRGVEDFMFDRLVEAARERGITTIQAEYLPTAKNAMVSDLLPRYGFAPAAQGELRELRPDSVSLASGRHFAAALR
jgi:FkbH-like protein